MRRGARPCCPATPSSRGWRTASSNAKRRYQRPVDDRSHRGVAHRVRARHADGDHPSPARFRLPCGRDRSAPPLTRTASPDSVLTLTAIILLLRPLEVWWIAPFVLAAACLSLVVPRRQARADHLAARRAARGRADRRRLAAVRQSHLPARLLVPGDRTRAVGPAPAATLAASSRWLLGAAFAMAVLWKAVLSPDYIDGRFFRVTLLTDERFADASLVFGGLSRDQMAENREFLEPLPEGAELLTPPAFVEPPRLRAFAAAATWGGLLLEASIALFCLIPAGGRMQLARHAALLRSASRPTRSRRWRDLDG